MPAPDRATVFAAGMPSQVIDADPVFVPVDPGLKLIDTVQLDDAFSVDVHVVAGA